MQKNEFDSIIKELSSRKEFLKKLADGKHELCVAHKDGNYMTTRLHVLDDVELKMLKEHSEKIVEELVMVLSEVVDGL